MKSIITAALIASVSALPVVAADYSAGSTAKSWGLNGEEQALFKAKVVDILCELTGDCAPNCGDGKRQLGLVRADDDVLIYPNKNSQPAFSGAAEELLPFCGQDVEVDGLMITEEELGAKNIYQVQKIRAVGDEEWTKASSWTKKWAKKHPEAKGKGPWFRRDPRVNGYIEETGYLGLGHDADKKFIEEWY